MPTEIPEFSLKEYDDLFLACTPGKYWELVEGTDWHTVSPEAIRMAAYRFAKLRDMGCMTRIKKSKPSKLQLIFIPHENKGGIGLLTNVENV